MIIMYISKDIKSAAYHKLVVSEYEFYSIIDRNRNYTSRHKRIGAREQ